MKIELRHSYQGRPSGERLLLAGIHEVEDGLGAYLVANGHAVPLQADAEPEASVDNTPDAPEEQPEESLQADAEPEARPARRR
jgi:hypothetical protein